MSTQLNFANSNKQNWT